MIDFTPIGGVKYKYDYEAIFRDIANGELPERETYRQLILEDLFFIVYFVMEIGIANHKFVVDACREVEGGPRGETLDIWAREHFKSTIITVAETVQYHLRNPERCTCIFSYKKPAAEDFLDSIRKTYEKDLMKWCFPDILYEKPDTESPSWSLQNGIVLRRKGTSRKEATIEASGLVEGMLTGKHFERRIYDDIETDDIKQNPEQMDKCFSKFEMSENLGMEGGCERVIGTFYSHCGPLIRIRDKKRIDGSPMYLTRIKPATDNGEIDGKPVLLSQERLDKLKMSEHFNSQQLCDPTPTGVRALHSEFLEMIDDEFIPRNVYKFMSIDPAGDDTTGEGDAWAIMVVGVEPKGDEAGNSNIYIMDAVISPLRHTEAIEEIVRMYMRNGVIQKVGVEKVALSTAEVHVANALKMRGRMISVENGSLEILRPAGRKKVRRIEEALSWPLDNGKVFVAKSVKGMYVERLKQEMDMFPYWHDDGLDALSYVYDMIKDYNFALRGRPRRKWRPRVVNTITGY